MWRCEESVIIVFSVHTDVILFFLRRASTQECKTVLRTNFRDGFEGNE